MAGRAREEGSAIVIDLGRYRRARAAPRRDVWIALLVAGAILVLLVSLAHPFETQASTGADARPSVLAD